jgi:predicted LPLAT superfamily acyltransferase
MSRQNNNLSASRGNRFGIVFFKCFMHILGLNHARNFVWVISFFYTIFDQKARLAALPYLSRRFPEAGKVKLFWHTYRLLTSQGQSLLTAFYLGNNHASIKYRSENIRNHEAYMYDKNQGFILLTSHFGDWQGSIRYFDEYDRSVSLLVEMDANVNVDKLMAMKGKTDNVKIISTSEPFGGLLSVLEAIENHEVVCIMGDRNYESNGIEIEFLGDKAIFPKAAFHLAAQLGCPIIPFSMVYDRWESMMVKYYGPIITIPANHKRLNSDNLRPFLEKYVAYLDDMTKRYPYHFFIFSDIWTKK